MNLIQFLALANAASPLPIVVADLLHAVRGVDFDWDEALAKVHSVRAANRIQDFFRRLLTKAEALGFEDLAGEIHTALEAIDGLLDILQEGRDAA